VTTDEIKAMRELRNEGYTYQEIAEKFGCTKQYVSYLIGQRARKNGKDIERIVYDGIYKLFVRDRRMTYRKFTLIAHGLKYDQYIRKNEYEVMRRFLRGERESRFSIAQIENMCKACGMSYEETFKRRDVV
jgi:transcriptional regulator with XRE-family HTH domain